MPTTTETTIPEMSGVPVAQFYRLGADQYRRMIEAGILADDEPVSLRDGSLVLAPSGPDPAAEGAYRLTVDQYRRMLAEGIITTLDRLELLGGRLVTRMSINPPHRIATRRARVALERIVPPGWYVDQQAPVSLPSSRCEPEPDIQVTRGDPDDYATRHPGPGDVAILVEVSDSSLPIDRGFKTRLYAAEGIPVYWIVNLLARRVEVYSDPTGPADAPAYRLRRDYGPEEEIPVVLDGRAVGRLAARDLLP